MAHRPYPKWRLLIISVKKYNKARQRNGGFSSLSWFKEVKDHFANSAKEMKGLVKKVSVPHFPRRCGYCLSFATLFRYYRQELMLWWAIPLLVMHTLFKKKQSPASAIPRQFLRKYHWNILQILGLFLLSHLELS